jgi:hypothetical protein
MASDEAVADLEKLVALKQTNPVLFVGSLGDDILDLFHTKRGRRLAEIVMGRVTTGISEEEQIALALLTRVSSTSQPEVQ